MIEMYLYLSSLFDILDICTKGVDGWYSVSCISLPSVSIVVTYKIYFGREVCVMSCYCLSKDDLISAATNVSTFVCRFPPDLLKKLSTDCIVMQNHHVSSNLKALFIQVLNIVIKFILHACKL